MLAFRHKVNEGLHLENGKVSIDIIVVAKGGSLFNGEACLEIRGVEGVDKMCIAPSVRLVHLGNDIYLGVLRTKKLYKRTCWDIINKIDYQREFSTKIKITYDFPREFKWELRDYG